MRRHLTAFVVLVGLLFVSALAAAAPRDKAAQKKIEEAIYTNFLNTDFDGAEGLLLGTIRACEDKCSPALVAKAWMYVGVIRGSGRNDLAGAQEAFTTAIGIDPNVALDNEIATDPVKAAFAKVKAGGGGGTGGETPPPPAAGGGGAFTCAPAPTEIETRRPFPLQCEADDKVQGAKIHYKSFNSGWQTVKMSLQAGSFRGTIPCSATQNTGGLQYYVEGLDADGEVIVNYGSEEEPKTSDVVSESTADPPAYPDEQPPARCAVGDTGGTPADTGGGAPCGGSGDACGANDCCQEGLTCEGGTCEAEGGKKGKAGPYPKNWVSLAFAMDFALVSSDGACTNKARGDNFVCFKPDGTTFVGPPSLSAPGKIDGGFVPATMRVLASYERLFGPIGLEGRVGFAFNGGQTPKGGNAFLPVHLEARAKWWMRGTQSFANPGFRPWLHVGGGLAQVDAKVNVGVVDCSTAPSAQQDPKYAMYPANCLAASSTDEAKRWGGTGRQLEATKQLGQAFIAFGGGVMYAIAKNHGAVLNLNFLVPVPSVGFVIEPSLGYAVGF